MSVPLPPPFEGILEPVGVGLPDLASRECPCAYEGGEGNVIYDFDNGCFRTLVRFGLVPAGTLVSVRYEHDDLELRRRQTFFLWAPGGPRGEKENPERPAQTRDAHNIARVPLEYVYPSHGPQQQETQQGHQELRHCDRSARARRQNAAPLVASEIKRLFKTYAHNVVYGRDRDWIVRLILDAGDYIVEMCRRNPDGYGESRVMACLREFRKWSQATTGDGYRVPGGDCGFQQAIRRGSNRFTDEIAIQFDSLLERLQEADEAG